MKIHQRTNYGYLLIGIVTMFLLTWAVPNRLFQHPLGWVLFVVAGLGIHAYILQNGGFLPKNGKTTIHSKIIFWATAVALLTVLAFILGVHFFILLPHE